jgi:hypothetical protein
MKNSFITRYLLAAAIFGAVSVQAGNTYSIDWHKIAAGGGTSSNAQYSLSGTMGQPDASVTLAGGAYSLTGGYWSLIALVQTASAPKLSITMSGSSAIISWPSASTGYLLQSKGSLSTANWSNYPATVVTNGAGTINSVTIAQPVGNLFFRLAR